MKAVLFGNRKTKGQPVSRLLCVLNLLAAACLTAMVLRFRCNGTTTPPHIIFIVADDLGWNDVGWHNPDINTPNLDVLANQGVILNSSYVLPMCSPSRAAFLTGYYPYHTGMQHTTIDRSKGYGVPLKFTFLPQMLKKAGYKTHMVGKWHLGFCRWEYTPTYRGFDSFYGYYSANEDYYTHYIDDALDLRDNEAPDRTKNGTYSAHLFSEKAISVIENHDVDKPLFLYLPYQSVHGPKQVPEEYMQPYMNVADKFRRIYSGMVSVMDEGIGNVTAALQRKGLLDNAVIIFISDNGGSSAEGASNWPLRGQKFSIWEGGTKAASFVWSKLLKKNQYVNDRQIHAVDWFPTILSLAGIQPEPGMDGVNQWATISEDVPTRTEFVYNIDDIYGTGAIRMGDFKLIEGNAGRFSGWYNIPRFNGDIPGWQKWDQYMEEIERDKNLVRLYNIKDDPMERHDLANQMPGKVRQMRARLAEYRKSLYPTIMRKWDPKSNPARWSGTWSPGWCSDYAI